MRIPASLGANSRARRGGAVTICDNSAAVDFITVAQRWVGVRNRRSCSPPRSGQSPSRAPAEVLRCLAPARRRSRTPPTRKGRPGRSCEVYIASVALANRIRKSTGRSSSRISRTGTSLSSTIVGLPAGFAGPWVRRDGLRSVRFRGRRRSCPNAHAAPSPGRRVSARSP